MTHALTRRGFLEASALSAVAAAFTSGEPATAADQPASSAGPSLKIRKAVKIGMVGVKGTLLEKFEAVKAIGYDGIELDSPNSLSLDEVIEARDKSGLPIHGVVDSVHWRQTLSAADGKVRAEGVAALERAIRDSKAYGGTSVLLVPAVVGRDVSYGDAYARSQEEIRKVIPLAKEEGIRILFENVWNDFLLSPLEFARYIDEFESPVVGAYFDVGNMVHYGWPAHWVQALGKRIGKLDVKGYSRAIADKEGKRAGFRAEIGDDDCDWAAVIAGLKQAGFTDIWATAEVRGGDAARLKEILDRMNKALATT